MRRILLFSPFAPSSRRRRGPVPRGAGALFKRGSGRAFSSRLAEAQASPGQRRSEQGEHVLRLTQQRGDSFRECSSRHDDLDHVSRHLGVVMQQARVVSRGQMRRPICLAISLAVLASGCASTSASGYGSGFAFNRAECNPTDSTVTCCLKQNPGQYERCGAVVPTTTQSTPNNLLPGRIESEAAPIPELPTEEERERWRTDICLPRYEKCMNAGGGSIPGRKKGETQCQACYDACMRHGYWPLRANEKPCPGA